MTKDELKTARKKLGYTVAEMALILGISHSYLEKCEGGKKPILTGLAVRVRELLGFSPETYMDDVAIHAIDHAAFVVNSAGMSATKACDRLKNALSRIKAREESS